MNSVRSNSSSLKYQRFTLSDCKDIWIRTFNFVTRTHFLYKVIKKRFSKMVVKLSDIQTNNLIDSR